MDLRAEVEMKIAKPLREVFDAIVDPAKMSNYFISGGTGRRSSSTVSSG